MTVLVATSWRDSYDLRRRHGRTREPDVRLRPPSRCRYKWTDSHQPSRWKR